MVYADYDYYHDTYLGTSIADADYPRLAKRASQHIDATTRWRAVGYTVEHPDDTRIKDATCAVAEALQEHDIALVRALSPGQIRGETNDGYSVTYVEMSASDADKRLTLRLQEAKRLYLQPTGLLYAGVGMC